MKRKHKRLTFIVLGMGLLAVAAALMLRAFEDTIVFFYSPTEVLDKKLGAERRVRIGGLVEDGSVEKAGIEVKFRVTDLVAAVRPDHRHACLNQCHQESQREGEMTGFGNHRAVPILSIWPDRLSAFSISCQRPDFFSASATSGGM